jgi:choline dehydrogenase-like flavoprotein
VTDRVLVIGSGASGVHFALSLLRKGRAVTMLDVGRQGTAAALPGATLTQLKDRLPDPSRYMLGGRFEAVLLPSVTDEYYGIPPTKDFVFERPSGFRHASTGFAPLFSFARGGLGEVWTGGSYPLNAGELVDFPFAHDDLAPHYDEVARRIGISGAADDLARFMPLHAHLQPPLRLDDHSQRLLDRYARVRPRLNGAGLYLGRSRVATLSQPIGSRRPCDYLGRCLWGCPHGALYTPSQTLRECQTFSDFEYVPGVEVRHLRLGPGGGVQSAVTRDLATGNEREWPATMVALAAGALLSTKIFLRTLQREHGRRIQLRGLMDNRQVLLPFVNLAMLGRQFAPESYQYHLLGMGLETSSGRDYVHGQITTLKTALLHPLIQRIPLDLGLATYLFRAAHAALGLVNVNFRDTRRETNFVELGGSSDDELHIHYEPDEDEPARIAHAMRRIRRGLHRLGCVVPPGMAHVRPMGASVHYAGTLPMRRDAAPFTTTAYGESRDVPNLFLVDGATFPFLPAKNITFTLMANAVRIAEAAF